MEPSQILDSLKKFADTKGNEKASGKGGIWVSIVMGIVALIAIIVFAYVSNRNSKELARLKHEMNKREIEAENAKTASEAAENDAKRIELEKDVNKARAEMDKIDKTIVDVKEAMNKNRVAIDSIKSWDDI
jgi:septal ring factor EnvC (AmiA/AmiB activator)